MIYCTGRFVFHDIISLDIDIKRNSILNCYDCLDLSTIKGYKRSYLVLFQMTQFGTTGFFLGMSFANMLYCYSSFNLLSAMLGGILFIIETKDELR